MACCTLTVCPGTVRAGKRLRTRGGLVDGHEVMNGGANARTTMEGRSIMFYM
jgi:hypothetical protein